MSLYCSSQRCSCVDPSFNNRHEFGFTHFTSSIIVAFQCLHFKSILRQKWTLCPQAQSQHPPLPLQTLPPTRCVIKISRAKILRRCSPAPSQKSLLAHLLFIQGPMKEAIMQRDQWKSRWSQIIISDKGAIKPFISGERILKALRSNCIPD